MDIDQLYYLQTLARVRIFTKASEELLLSQPALSRSISRLEEEIGAPLFERKNRGVTLNQYGKVFLEHTARALQENVHYKNWRQAKSARHESHKARHDFSRVCSDIRFKFYSRLNWGI